MRRVLSALAVALCTAFSSAASAQGAEQTIVLPSPIMVIDFERVFGETLYGQRIAAEIDAERELVQSENDRLAAELLSEESDLTAARTTMDQESFRTAAEAFNEKAQTVRASREEEQARLVNLRDTERARFVERIQPVISSMMRERGAIVCRPTKFAPHRTFTNDRRGRWLVRPRLTWYRKLPAASRQPCLIEKDPKWQTPRPAPTSS